MPKAYITIVKSILCGIILKTNPKKRYYYQRSATQPKPILLLVRHYRASIYYFQRSRKLQFFTTTTGLFVFEWSYAISLRYTLGKLPKYVQQPPATFEKMFDETSSGLSVYKIHNLDELKK